MCTSPRQNVISDEQIKSLLTNLTMLPKRVQDTANVLAEAENDAYNAAREIEAAKQNRTDYEQGVKAEVGLEVIENGNGKSKSKYGSEDKRNAEARKRCVADDEWQALHQAVHDAYAIKSKAEMRIAMARNSMFYVKNLWDSAIAATRLAAALCNEGATVADMDNLKQNILMKVKEICND